MKNLQERQIEIAQFIGYEYAPADLWYKLFNRKKEHYYFQEADGYVERIFMDELSTHMTWDLIMGAVVKIESLGYTFLCPDTTCWFVRKGEPQAPISSHIGATKIEAVVEAVYGYISMHHNKQKEKVRNFNTTQF